MFLVGEKVNRWIRILEGPRQDPCEQMNSKGEDILIVTNEDDFLL